MKKLTQLENAVYPPAKPPVRTELHADELQIQLRILRLKREKKEGKFARMDPEADDLSKAVIDQILDVGQQGADGDEHEEIGEPPIRTEDAHNLDFLDQGIDDVVPMDAYSEPEVESLAPSAFKAVRIEHDDNNLDWMLGEAPVVGSQAFTQDEANSDGASVDISWATEIADPAAEAPIAGYADLPTDTSQTSAPEPLPLPGPHANPPHIQGDSTPTALDPALAHIANMFD